MNNYSNICKAFLIAALVYVLDNVLGFVVALIMNLSDPLIGGTSRDNWFGAGTPLTAPGFFVIVYSLFLLFATRQHWLGVVGTIVVTLMTFVSGFSLLPDHEIVQRVWQDHLNIATGFTLVVLFAALLSTFVLGISTLIQLALARRASRASAVLS